MPIFSDYLSEESKKQDKTKKRRRIWTEPGINFDSELSLKQELPKTDQPPPPREEESSLLPPSGEGSELEFLGSSPNASPQFPSTDDTNESMPPVAPFVPLTPEKSPDLPLEFSLESAVLPEKESERGEEGPLESNKKTTNRLQKGNKRETNREQIDYKWETKREQTGDSEGSKQTTEKKIDYKWVTKQTTDKSTNRLQKDYNKETNREQEGDFFPETLDFSGLVGHEKNLVEMAFRHCLNKGSLFTSPISNEYAMKLLDIRTPSTYKTVLGRVIRKGFLRRCGSKKGRGGWTKLELNKEVYQWMITQLEVGQNGNGKQIDYKQATNREQIDYKQATKQATEQTTRPPSSSSYININTTTTNTGGTNESSPPKTEFLEVDTTPLEKYGLHEGRLTQIIQRGVFNSVEELQTSIYHLAFYLNSPDSKGIHNPINWIMKQLLQGYVNRPYGYKSPKELAYEKYLEDKKQEQERIRGLKEGAWDKADKEKYRALVRPGLEKEFGKEGAKLIVDQEAKKLFFLEIEKGPSVLDPERPL